MTADTVTPGVLRRIACMLYEALLLCGVVFVAGVIFTALTHTGGTAPPRLGLQIFLFFIIGAYFVWFWSKGQTLAMKTWHLHICLLNGAPITYWRAIFRYLLGWTWVLPPLAISHLLQLSSAATLMGVAAWVVTWFIPVLYHRNHQFPHETWSGTKLVHLKSAALRSKQKFFGSDS